MQDLEESLSVSEIAQYLGVSIKTVYRWLRNGRLPARRAGWFWLVRREDLRRWMSEREARRNRRRPPEVVIQQLDRISADIGRSSNREFSSEDIADLIRTGREERAAGMY
jgi:excisionase family DNA binding protein